MEVILGFPCQIIPGRDLLGRNKMLFSVNRERSVHLLTHAAGTNRPIFRAALIHRLLLWKCGPCVGWVFRCEGERERIQPRAPSTLDRYRAALLLPLVSVLRTTLQVHTHMHTLTLIRFIPSNQGHGAHVTSFPLGS